MRGKFLKALSEEFMNDLSKQDGMLHSILARVKEDHTLMLAIREDYINIYYRGGNILKVTKHRGYYKADFDTEFSKSGQPIPDLPGNITNQDDAKKWVASFQDLKGIMDGYFSTHGKAEREFQQLVARENNYSTISSECEYYISDIEYTDPADTSARFDILAIRWLRTQRKDGRNCKAALIEMKYGDGALRGDAGIIEHLKDMHDMISNKERYDNLLKTMESQFNQLEKLGLLRFNKSKSFSGVKIADKKPEVIFIFANHNPNSSKLETILSGLKIDAHKEFDLKFYVASFAGYGLHAKCMRTLAEFRNLCEVKKRTQKEKTEICG